jgi:PAS domain-containing protein
MNDIRPAFEDGRGLAQTIVNTAREPLLVLDKDLRVVAASRSFYVTFQADRQEMQGRLLSHWPIRCCNSTNAGALS